MYVFQIVLLQVYHFFYCLPTYEILTFIVEICAVVYLVMLLLFGLGMRIPIIPS